MDQAVCSTQDLQCGMTKKQEGKEYVYLKVASACTKNTPYAWYTCDSSARPTQSAVPGASAICKVAVATETLTAAGYSWFQTKGYVAAMITPNITGVTLQALKIASALVAAGGATTLTPDDFAICITGATALVFPVYLLGREITPS